MSRATPSSSSLPRSGGEGDQAKHGGGVLGEAATIPLHQPSAGPPPHAAHGEELPPLAGSLQANGSLADFIWFRAGGPAEWLARPRDADDLARFLHELDPAVPVLPVGVGSNLIVRDGGVPGVVVRLPKAMAHVHIEQGNRVRAGGGAMGISVASKARDAHIAGLEFLRGIPGTAGGAVRMNAGAYGREVADILVEATLVRRDGSVETWPRARFGYTYRHSEVPEGAVVVEALFEGVPGDRAAIGAEMDRIAAEREASQPLRSRTGGSTFKNPPGTKAWKLIDAAGCRGLTIGEAQVSEKHCNFLLNLGNARAADIEALGEEVRRRVYGHSGIQLEWEIQRVGRGG
ncbi:MAG: UDP-N-acetylmuramate dehydrogenase [Sphingomonadales bacterium]|nr:UDP-N-acetylmuramate dehydrogenase [Sphingomonadales bacterium]